MKQHPIYQHLDDVEPYIMASDGDLLSIPPPPMLIEDVLPRGGVMGITSYPGVGKSWLALEMCRALSTGEKFLGHFPSKVGSALFVGSDSSLYDYARQWQRLGRTQRAEFAEQTRDADPQQMESAFGPDWNLGVFNSMRFLIQSSFMIDDFDQVRRLIKTCYLFEHGPLEAHYESDRDLLTGEENEEFVDMARPRGYDLIVFDTLSRLSRANQNDNTEMENVFRNVRLIAESTGAAVVLLHHNSKPSEYNDGSDWRGAMSQIGALDSWIQLSPGKQRKERIHVQYKKFRGITPDDFTYLMEVSQPEIASLTHIEGEEAVTASSDGICLSLLGWFQNNKHEGGASVADLANALFPEYADLFPGGTTKFKAALRNRLYDKKYGLVDESNSPIEKVSVPGTGRAVKFQLRKVEPDVQP
jgi:hypothetical protein